MFRSGAVPEIIRSHQKDELYLTYLRSTCADLAQTLFGMMFIGASVYGIMSLLKDALIMSSISCNLRSHLTESCSGLGEVDI